MPGHTENPQVKNPWAWQNVYEENSALIRGTHMSAVAKKEGRQEVGVCMWCTTKQEHSGHIM
jgi:hypothetical protein